MHNMLMLRNDETMLDFVAALPFLLDEENKSHYQTLSSS